MEKYRSVFEKDPEIERAKENYDSALKEYAAKNISMPLDEFLGHLEAIDEACNKINRFLERTEDGKYRVKKVYD